MRDWFQKQGVFACENTIIKGLNKLGFVYKRFSKTMPQNTLSSIEKKARITELVEAIGNDSSADIDVLFVDESHFLQNTIQLSVFDMS